MIRARSGKTAAGRLLLGAGALALLTRGHRRLRSRARCPDA